MRNLAVLGCWVASFMAGHAFAIGMFGWAVIFGVLAILDLIGAYRLTNHKV